MTRKKDIQKVDPVRGEGAIHGKSANAVRQKTVAVMLKRVERHLGQVVDEDVLRFFVPCLDALTERDLGWVLRMLNRVRTRGGIGQETYARLFVVLVRLPGGFNGCVGPRPQAVVCRNWRYPLYSPFLFVRWWPDEPNRAAEFFDFPNKKDAA